MGAPNHCGGTVKSQKCHKHFLQYNKFASERDQVRTWGCQTCFMSRAPSNLVTPLLLSPVTTYTGTVSSIHNSADTFGKRFYQVVSVNKMQKLQKISSKQLYTEFLCLQIPTASQKSVMKQENPVWKSLWANAEFSFCSNYLVQSSFLFGVGTAFPHLFFSTAPLMFITRLCSDEERTWFGLLDWTFLTVRESRRQSYAPVSAGSVSH